MCGFTLDNSFNHNNSSKPEEKLIANKNLEEASKKNKKITFWGQLHVFTSGSSRPMQWILRCTKFRSVGVLDVHDAQNINSRLNNKIFYSLNIDQQNNQ